MRIWSPRTAAAARSVPEYELLDTGVFAENRYFDVFVEYAQAEPGDMLMKITAWNRGGESAALHLHPATGPAQHLDAGSPARSSPNCAPSATAPSCIEPAALGMSRLYFDGDAELLFTENETNALRLWNMGGAGYFKDGFHERIVGGHADAVNPAQVRHQGRRVVSARPSPAAASGNSACGCRGAPSRRPSRTSTAACPCAAPRPTSTTTTCRRTSPRPMSAWSSARRSPG